MKKKEIVFATHNAHKAKEIQNLLGDAFVIKTLSDVGIHEDIPETGETLEQNALIKSSYVYNLLGCNVFSDDTGLEVHALKGEPGVYSARYAGHKKNDKDNMSLLIQNLSNHTDKSAQFKTVISLFWEDQHVYFKGIAKGVIIDQLRGEFGFGYDPIFIPNGYDQTFAEMESQQKNALSHRGKAIQQMIEFLLS